MKNTSPEISIVILTFNSERFIPFCLESLKPYYNNPEIEIIVVDNASKDKTLEVVRNLNIPVKIIELKINKGCAGGNNAGWRAASGKYIVFLNPDIYVKPSLAEKIIEPLKTREDIGLAGCKLYYPNSHIIQHAGGILYPNAMADHYGNGEEDKGQYDEEKFVDFVTGAAFAVKRALLEELGGFDEFFFPAYYEETDFCMRVRKHGLKVLYNPQAVAWHYESSSLTKLSESFYRIFYKSRIIFLAKHYSLSDWLTKFLPFEIRWMLFEPKARTTRFKQFRAYLNIPGLVLKRLRSWK